MSTVDKDSFDETEVPSINMYEHQDFLELARHTISSADETLLTKVQSEHKDVGKTTSNASLSDALGCSSMEGYWSKNTTASSESLTLYKMPQGLPMPRNNFNAISSGMSQERSILKRKRTESITTDSVNMDTLSEGIDEEKFKHKFLIIKGPKLIKFNEDQVQNPNLRRSRRNRLPTLDKRLGQKPIYEVDENGLMTLIGVSEVVVKDPLFIKYGTTNFYQIDKIRSSRKSFNI